MSGLTCAEVRARLFDYLDGLGEAGDRAAMGAHLDACPDCAAELRASEGMERRMRQALAGDRAPDGLWDRVMADIDADAAAGPRGRRFGWPVLATAAAAFAVLLIAVVGLVLPPERRTVPAAALVVEPVNDFITYRLSGRPLDVESADPAKLARWFTGKTESGVPRRIPAPRGFRLVGSRLCYFLNRRLAALMYRTDAGLLSLYVMSDHDIVLPEARPDPAAGRALSSHRVNDHTSLIWRDGGRVYVLVSDLPEAEMRRFVHGLRAALRRAPAAYARVMTTMVTSIAGVSARAGMTSPAKPKQAAAKIQPITPLAMK